MVPRHQDGFTWVEVFVSISVLAVLIALALPPITGTHCGGGRMTQNLSNAKQLHLATQQMALDAETTGDTNIGWPGDTGGSFSSWARQLTEGNYLTTNDLCKLLSAPDVIVSPGRIPAMKDSAVLLYTVSTNTDGSAVFLTSANFTNTSTGGAPPLASAKPYGNKGFIVFRKAGDGAILQPRQAGNTNIVGTFVPLCR